MPPQLIKYGPFFIGLVAGIAAAAFLRNCRVEPLEGLPIIGTTLGVIISGFAATQRSMLLTLGGTRILRHLVRTEYHNDVLTYMMQCIYAGIVVSVVSVFGMFVEPRSTAWSLWVGCFVGALATTFIILVRNEMMTVRVIKRLLEERGSSGS